MAIGSLSEPHMYALNCSLNLMAQILCCFRRINMQKIERLRNF